MWLGNRWQVSFYLGCWMLHLHTPLALQFHAELSLFSFSSEVPVKISFPYPSCLKKFSPLYLSPLSNIFFFDWKHFSGKFISASPKGMWFPQDEGWNRSGIWTSDISQPFLPQTSLALPFLLHILLAFFFLCLPFLFMKISTKPKPQLLLRLSSNPYHFLTTTESVFSLPGVDGKSWGARTALGPWFFVYWLCHFRGMTWLPYKCFHHKMMIIGPILMCY